MIRAYQRIKDSEKRVVIAVYVPEHIKTIMSEIADNENVSVSNLIRTILQNHIKKELTKNENPTQHTENQQFQGHR